MKSLTGLCSIALLTLGLTACSQAPPDNREADAKALRDLETQWNQDFAGKDAEKLLAHYTDDAVLMGPATPPAVGKDAIRKVLKDMVADPALSLKFQTAKVEVAKSGDVASTQGAYTMTMTDPVSKRQITDQGSYVTTYRKGADGAWKAVLDIASSEVPPSSPPKAAVKKKRKR